MGAWGAIKTCKTFQNHTVDNNALRSYLISSRVSSVPTLWFKRARLFKRELSLNPVINRPNLKLNFKRLLPLSTRVYFIYYQSCCQSYKSKHTTKSCLTSAPSSFNCLKVLCQWTFPTSYRRHLRCGWVHCFQSNYWCVSGFNRETARFIKWPLMNDECATIKNEFYLCGGFPCYRMRWWNPRQITSGLTTRK